MGDIMYDNSSLLNAHVFIVHYYLMDSIIGITEAIAVQILYIYHTIHENIIPSLGILIRKVDRL